ncbi:MAG TPA: SDR family oxidoreductase [Devosia sp.]
MTDFRQSKILVAGAGGKLGRRVVELLLEGGATQVIAGSRHPEKLDISSVETRKVDFADSAGLDAAFAGVDQLLIISTDVTGEVRQKLQTNAVAAAKRAGIPHIVYTSLVHPGPDSPVLLAPDHDITERAIEATGADYTFLRNAYYMENFLHSLPAAFASGHWYAAWGQGRSAHVSREDCARAAAGALLGGPRGKRIIDVAGPEALTAEEVAAIASEITGRPLAVVHVDDAALTAGMVGAGLPQPVAELLTSIETSIRMGHSDVATQVAELTGRAPLSIKDFLSANKAALGA